MRYQEAVRLIETGTDEWVNEDDELEAASFGEFLGTAMLGLGMVILISAIAYVGFAALLTMGMSGLT